MDTIRGLREAAGLTQAELAHRSGVAQPNIAAYESGRRQASDAMLTRLREAMSPRPSEMLERHRVDVRALLARRRLRRPKVFGSVAHGTDRPGSDIDIVVEVPDDVDLLEIIDAADELEALLGCRVDLVTARSLRPDHRIVREMIPL